MKKSILLCVIALLSILQSQAGCFLACTDVDEDGYGTEYLVETNDLTGEVVSVTPTSNNCLFGPWARPCSLSASGPIDEDFTNKLSRIDLKLKRLPTAQEKVYLENLIRSPGKTIFLDKKRLSPELIVLIQGRN